MKKKSNDPFLFSSDEELYIMIAMQPEAINKIKVNRIHKNTIMFRQIVMELEGIIPQNITKKVRL